MPVSYILTSLIYRDLDDGDHNNALILAERLFALNNDNDYYRFVYAKCLYQLKDYSAVYTLLNCSTSVPNLNLFAKSCLELGLLVRSSAKQHQYWKDGVKALKAALSLDEPTDKIHWRDELSSISVRQHIPSKASMYNLLGDLYAKLDHIRGAATSYWSCLKLNPFKLTAYTKLCDIAPDIPNFEKAKLPKDIFVDFDLDTTDLSTSANTPMMPSFSAFADNLTFNVNVEPLETQNNKIEILKVQKEYSPITLNDLRQFAGAISNMYEDKESLFVHDIERYDIEDLKTKSLASIIDDVEQAEKKRAFENKHGLYKKPTEQTDTQKLNAALSKVNAESSTKIPRKRTIAELVPPRVTRSENVKRSKANPTEVTAEDIQSYFTPIMPNIGSSSSDVSNNKNDDGMSKLMVESMNQVIKLLRIIANGYLYQSFYHPRRAALELQQLDDNQYGSPRILSIIGKALHDSTDFKNAKLFFKHAFAVAPWFFDYAPVYSTCLWYLQQDKELDIVAYCIKDNPCHQYESNIVAGNWSKCSKDTEKEALEWFKKAVSVKPTDNYGYYLLGHEYLLLGDNLNALRNFANSLRLNKRSSISWFGVATTQMAMGDYTKAKAMLLEAIRLQPKHHIMLRTMAEILIEEHQYEEALNYIQESLNLRWNSATEELREKVERMISG
ncbi:hypothetical protein BDF20DRAFT_891462 [Mycotypha africana]|uniref:uncharacterized protein n=1 Tax=Mycotypha africana TaxID=64632 RepID=UPI002301CDB9|nr:uncharacterized protein BDF20DRAFT_891462 [Mycotypha africana]KAI8970465.1 hypothetical protein BDF20DRAFT_891462 [Mycotypha africana]